MSCLKKLGYVVFHEEILAYEAYNQDFPDWKPPGVVALTSQIALHFLKTQKELKSLTSVPCYCIGGTTATQAETIGFSNVIVEHGDGVNLAKKILDHAKPIGPVLHPCAYDYDAAMGHFLTEKGCAYQPWPIYRTVMKDKFSNKLSSALQNGQIQAVLFMSARTAQAFVQAAQMNGNPEIYNKIAAFALSPKVAAVLRMLPWKILAVAAKPDQTSLIKELTHLLPPSEKAKP